MKLLDRYIVTRFLGTFAFTMAIILSVAVVFDVSERLNHFSASDATLQEILFDYYLGFVTLYGNQFSALIIFIAVIFMTSRMAANTEIVAILSGGISFNRLMRPFLIAATLLAIAATYLNNFAVPTTNEAFMEFKNRYIDDNGSFRYKHIHRVIEDDSYLYLESYNTRNRVGYHFSLERFEAGELREKLTADFARYDSIRGMWRLENYLIRTLDGPDESLFRGRELDTVLAFSPADLSIGRSNIETMDYFELRDFIAAKEKLGVEHLDAYRVENYRRFSLSFATFILTVIGVTLSFRKQRGGLGLNLALGFMLVLVYIFFMQVSVTFAVNGNMEPWLAVWMPNFIFGWIALFLYRRALR